MIAIGLISLRNFIEPATGLAGQDPAGLRMRQPILGTSMNSRKMREQVGNKGREAVMWPAQRTLVLPVAALESNQAHRRMVMKLHRLFGASPYPLA